MFAFVFTNALAVRKTVKFYPHSLAVTQTKNCYLMNAASDVMMTFSFDYDATNEFNNASWLYNGVQYPLIRQFGLSDTNKKMTLKVSGSKIRTIRWYAITSNTASSRITFASATSGEVGWNETRTQLTSDVGSDGYAYWTGEYSGGDLVITLPTAQIGYSFVEVDYDDDESSSGGGSRPVAYPSSLSYTTTMKYSPGNNVFTFSAGQFSAAAQHQNGYNGQEISQYAITPTGMNFNEGVSGIVSSKNAGQYQTQVTLQTATPKEGTVTIRVNGYYTNKGVSDMVAINVTINFVPEITTPKITVANQQEHYTGEPIPFTISPTSTNSSTSFTYTYGTGLTKTGVNTCTALEEGTYTVNIKQDASSWYNEAYATAKLTVLPELVTDFWPVPDGFSKSNGYTENFISACPLTFGEDSYGCTAGTNDDLDFTTNDPENKRFFEYYTKGTKAADGNASTLPTTGTYYKFESSKADQLLTVGLKISKRCKFYLLDHDKSAGTITSLTQYGSELETWNGANGTVSLFTKANHDYYFFSTDEPLAIYGYRYNNNIVTKYGEKDGFLTVEKDWTK